MDIELLRTFLSVRENRHFGKAAQSLNITQAAASLRIKQLETMLNAPLFVRVRNNLQLTETGERLVPYAEDILLSWEIVQLQFSDKKDENKTLRFGAINGFCEFVLKECLSAIYGVIAGVNLRIEAYEEEALQSRLQEKRIDLALLYEPSRYIEYQSIPVSSVELVHVASTPELTQADTLREKYVAVEWGSFYNNRLYSLATFMQEPVLRVTQSSYALQFLLGQGGHAFLPYRMVMDYLGDRLFLVEDSQVLHQPIYAVYQQSSALGEEIRKVIDVISHHAGPYTRSLDDVMAEYLDIPAAS